VRTGPTPDRTVWGSAPGTGSGRLISAKKNEPDWLSEWRLRAYQHWITLAEPTWQHVAYGPVDYQDIIYYAAPKPKKQLRVMIETCGWFSARWRESGAPFRG